MMGKIKNEIIIYEENNHYRLGFFNTNFISSNYHYNVIDIFEKKITENINFDGLFIIKFTYETIIKLLII